MGKKELPSSKLRESDIQLTRDGFSPTQIRILEILADGQPHSRQEIEKAFLSKKVVPNNFYNHLSILRKKLEAKGETILCVSVNRRSYWRHVRLLASPYDGND